MKILHMNVAVLGSALLLSNVCIADDMRYGHEKGKAEFQFALIGDTPYGVLPGQTDAAFDALMQDINSTKRLQWVMHAGDIKSGSTECSDEMFMDRYQRYSHFNKPFIMTLGDNEWTDCHRVNNGEYQPLERLAKLREVFFSNPGTSLGEHSMQVKTQADVAGFEEFPENVRWTKSGVVFSTMHIVGSNNALKAFDPASTAVRTQADDDEVVRRTRAAITWMEETFAVAKQKDAPGVFLMIHANPGLEHGAANRTGFEEFLAALENHVKDFSKPVVLAHGDSHYFRVDKPSINNSMDNFTRVETFGSANVNWVRVSVDPNNEEVFNFQQEIVK